MKRLVTLLLALGLVACGSVTGPGGGGTDLGQAGDTLADGIADGCTPQCGGRQCGPDGCGGSCGTCTGMLHCNVGQCTMCQPACTGKECGDDGCGGQCGTCGAGLKCNGSTCAACQPQCTGRQCGDDGCGGDCGTCTGLTTCKAGLCSLCTASCAGRECGDDGCGGTCGTCGPGKTCSTAGACTAGCTAACAGRECGDDGCQGSCGTCGTGKMCAAGKCTAMPDCTNVTKIGCCDGPTLWACAGGKAVSQDCTAAPTCGWSAAEGGYACGTAGSEAPGGTFALDCPWVCHPACAGLECGDDGCAGSCGSCTAGKTCAVGKCVGSTCSCGGRSCGTDGCGGSCGTCAIGQVCTDAGQCTNNCTASCAGRTCGSDGCGKTCAPGCPQGQFCTAQGQCSTQCQPQCDGRQCGDDGCGKTCGTCPNDALCTLGGTCGSGCQACSFTKDCLNFGFETGNLASFATTGSPLVVKALGAATPVEGTYMAELPNAPADSWLIAQTCVPAGTTSLRFAWKLYSEEFKEFCGSKFQDAFTVRLAVDGGADQVVFQRTINDLCAPTDGGGQTGGTGTCGTACGKFALPLTASDVQFDIGDTWMTGWQEAHVNLAMLPAGKQATVELRFEVTSAGDAAYETLVLLDDIAFIKGCAPSCGTATCGSDGCGGTCGWCGTAGKCVGGQCQCTPSCAGKTCGDNGCGGTCGTCGTGQTCQAGVCTGPVCTPTCVGKTCGDNGCGGSCGTCASGLSCSSGKCGTCTPTCGTATCGDDGCGGSCGTCASGQACADLSAVGSGLGSLGILFPGALCSCTSGADCSGGEPCQSTADICSITLIGALLCPSGTMPQGTPNYVCYDLTKLLGGI